MAVETNLNQHFLQDSASLLDYIGLGIKDGDGPCWSESLGTLGRNDSTRKNDLDFFILGCKAAPSISVLSYLLRNILSFASCPSS